MFYSVQHGPSDCRHRLMHLEVCGQSAFKNYFNTKDMNENVKTKWTVFFLIHYLESVYKKIEGA